MLVLPDSSWKGRRKKEFVDLSMSNMARTSRRQAGERGGEGLQLGHHGSGNPIYTVDGELIAVVLDNPNLLKFATGNYKTILICVPAPPLINNIK
jgi:hypothetical protein